MKSYLSKEIIKILNKDEWYHVNTVGDHHHFKHPTKAGKVTVTHPKKDVPIKTALSIFNQAGIKIN
ncbi:type II toxin-antitoxin system HicA family toxin [Desulforamulus aeronauticus]|uniref:type II toxin-antitoxin system HicA family toxin n=1 Tax=Desulforamulus aeronauticus TaxID=53343 RepID=UPI0009351E6F|nr:type II toxin-antitoxin system HicA family toxin [Desulforamulus aeronauticus]